MNINGKLLLTVFLILVLPFGSPASGPGQPGKKKTVRLFIIGNSFSQNATTYLPQLAEEAGHSLTIGRAELGGCSLQRHWEIAAAAEADTADPKGKAYKGKSLRMLLSDGPWDVVTIQQYSLLSGDVGTYQPYADKLIALIRSIQPRTRILFHQTWAYRSDAKAFGKINGEERAADDREMWEKARTAYRSVAGTYGLGVIPSGDAFRAVVSDPEWGFRKDNDYHYSQPEYPSLPNQAHSLHVGYRWNKNRQLTFDANHAGPAGCYLGSLVWYACLFGESPARLTFAPEQVTAAQAAHFRKVAWKTVKRAGK